MLRLRSKRSPALRVSRLLALGLAVLAVLAVPATAASQRSPTPTIKQAHQAIHRVDAYAVIGHCHRTRYSVICRVAHEIEARTEAGAHTTAAVYLIDRVHWHRGHTTVSVLWEGTASVSV